MKDILSYYYQIIISDEKINNGYFSYHNHLFCLYKYQRIIDEIKELVLLNNYMLNKGIQINKIIFNIYSEPLTFYNNNYYVLILINYEYKGGYFKFIEIDNEFKTLQRNNWQYLWSSKIDYIEYQAKHLENSYKLLMESVNYYIGLSENALKYFKLLNVNSIPLYISHRRVNEDILYNPVELVIDYKVRDLSEYLKKCFFNNNKDIYDIKKYLMKIELNEIDYLLLYVRMLFPSYYFDIYEDIINNNKDDKEILKIINKSYEYEKLLYELYLLIRRKNNIISIDWINEKFR